MADFAGWEMPIQYKGIIAEHQAVRQGAGLFDVSHMGIIDVKGPDAEKLLDHLSTNRISGHPPFSATYTVWCHENGNSVDDVMIYRLEDASHFMVVVNAGNRQKDLDHLLIHSKGMNVTIKDHFSGMGILALQGPKAQSLLASLYPEISSLKPMQVLLLPDLTISRTGYTGAGGYEIYAPDATIVTLWDQLLALGAEPVGLGARDTLRLEMGFALYGHELNDTIAPTESVSAWTVKWDKDEFIGKKALKELEDSGHKRFAYGIKLIDRGIARQDYPILKNGKIIGKATSGSFSPSLNGSIALILVESPLELGAMVEMQIRQSLCQCEVVKIPFVRKVG